MAAKKAQGEVENEVTVLTSRKPVLARKLMIRRYLRILATYRIRTRSRRLSRSALTVADVLGKRRDTERAVGSLLHVPVYKRPDMWPKRHN